MNLNTLFHADVFGYDLYDLLVFLIKIILIYIFTRVVSALIKYVFRRAIQRKGRMKLEEANGLFIQRICVAAVYIVGIAAFLSLIPGMEKVSQSILASAGILAAAAGLASQDALSNIVGGLFIIFSKPFRVGDHIQVDDTVTGTVIEITLRHTIIRNSENRMILIPNSTINSATIINSSYEDTAICSMIDVGVSYSTDLDFAINVMRDEIMKHPMLIDRRSEQEKANGTPQVIVRVITLGDSAITLRAWAWAANNGNAYVMKCDLLKAVKERFDKEHIEIPYPYYNQIIMKSEA